MDSRVRMGTTGMGFVAGNRRLEVMGFQIAHKDSTGMELLVLLSQLGLPISIVGVDTNGEDLHVELPSMDHLLRLVFMEIMGC